MVARTADRFREATINWAARERTVINALDQALRYAKGSQQAGKGQYPHPYGNTDKLKFENEASQCKPGNEYFEFPLIAGRVFSAGKNAKTTPGSPGDPGASRIVYQYDSSTDTAVYCGSMSHETKVRDANGQLPFSLCA